MLTLLVVLATQTGRTAITDTIAGMVTGPGGRPLAGAIVQATSAVAPLSRWQTSDAAGRFTIHFPGRAQYQLTAYYFGLVRGLGVGACRYGRATTPERRASGWTWRVSQTRSIRFSGVTV